MREKERERGQTDKKCYAAPLQSDNTLSKSALNVIHGMARTTKMGFQVAGHHGPMWNAGHINQILPIAMAFDRLVTSVYQFVWLDDDDGGVSLCVLMACMRCILTAIKRLPAA